MKLLALLAIPWMAANALASPTGPEPVTVRFGADNPLAEKGFKLGDECYVNPGLFSLLGWGSSIIEGGVEVSNGERSAKVGFLAGQELRWIPLRSALKELGYRTAWTGQQRVLTVLSDITRLEITPEKFQLESTLPVLASLTRSKDGQSIVLDIQACQIRPGISQLNTGEATIEEKQDSSLRISIPTDKKPSEIPNKPTKSLNILFSDSGQDLDRDPNTTPTTNPNSKWVIADRLVNTSRTDSILTYEMALSNNVLVNAEISYPDPSQLEIFLPYTRLTAQKAADLLPEITALTTRESERGTTISCTLERPMGVEISTAKGKLILKLYRPKTGDGKIAGKIIVVDPGHGGEDSGAVSNNGAVSEKNLNLAIGKAVSEALSMQGATVIMTRKTNIRIPLKDRAEVANRNKADFFISIHINSNKLSNSRSGCITFFHAKDPLSGLLARCIQKDLPKSTGIPGIGVWSDTQIYGTGFAVLRYSKMPAVLLELGFINHSRDLKTMTQQEFPAKVAEAVLKGLKTYLGSSEKVKP